MTEATFIPIAAVLGGLLGSTIARVCKLNRAEIRRWTEDGAYVGAVVGLLLYLILLGLGV